MQRFATSLGSSVPANYSGCAWACISDFGEAENMESSIRPPASQGMLHVLGFKKDVQLIQVP
jgi:hypothetical protein